MNYQRIHDAIIHRSQSRLRCIVTKYESHHILPKCEGGEDSAATVFLTEKEHRLIHRLRYKITGVLGNILAYNLLRYGRNSLGKNHKLISSLGGKSHHLHYRNRDALAYSNRQRAAGISGGNNCKSKQLGFFTLTESQKNAARNKGRATTVNNKIGMFSDEFREKHKQNLQKKIKTPNGVFDSMTAASTFYKVSAATITYRVKSNTESWKNWTYITGDCHELA